MVFDSTRFITSLSLSLSASSSFFFLLDIRWTICPCVATYKRVQSPRGGRDFFFLSFFLPFLFLSPCFFSSRVEIRDRCLTFSRIPSGTKSSGNSNSRGGIELRRIREFEKRNCARVVEIVESVTIKIFINTNGYIERNYWTGLVKKMNRGGKGGQILIVPYRSISRQLS